MKKILLLVLITGVILFGKTLTVSAASNLNVSVYPAEIDQLEKYVITATNSDGAPFTGTLQTQYWVCPLTVNSHTESGCVVMPSNTFAIPQSGKAVQNLAFYPNNYGPAIAAGKYFMQWKPATGNYDWSNETVVVITPLNMKRYFNLTDGNYYRYNANNLKMNQVISDATRLDIKNENFCNEDTTSMYFSKTNKYAYWNPSYSTNDSNGGALTTSDFMVWRPRWNEKGELETKSWSNYKPQALPTDLNFFPSSGFLFANLKSQTYQLGVNQPPYIYAFNNYDLNQYKSGNGYVTNQVKFGVFSAPLSGESESQYNTRFCRDAPINALGEGFNTMPLIKWYAKVVETPAYIGPVVVVNMREVPKGGYNSGGSCNSVVDFPQNCPGVLREDWFMAKDIGMVRFDVKNFGEVYDVPSPTCSNDPDCQNDGPMTNPFVKQQLTSYRAHYPQEKYLTITNQSDKSRKFNIHVNRNDFSDLNFLSTLNQIQLVVDDDANWDNDYAMRVMVHMRDNGLWKSANQTNGIYYVYEKESDGSNYGWQAIPVTSKYSNTTLGFNVSIDGLLYDGEDLNVSINEDDGAKEFSLVNKNIYLYLEGQNGVLGVIPLFAQGQDTYQGYTLAKIGKFTPAIIPPTTTPLPGDLDSDGHVNIYDYNLLVSKFGNPYTIFDYNDLVGNFGI